MLQDGQDKGVGVDQVEKTNMCICVDQVEKQRDELKADKDKVTADKDRLQQEWVTLQAEMQKRDIQMEEMKKEVGCTTIVTQGPWQFTLFSEGFFLDVTVSQQSIHTIKFFRYYASCNFLSSKLRLGTN